MTDMERTWQQTKRAYVGLAESILDLDLAHVLQGFGIAASMLAATIRALHV
jgi:hypothetical protein